MKEKYIYLGKKFGEKHLGKFVSDFYQAFREGRSSKFIFDFSDIEWIANEELLVV